MDFTVGNLGAAILTAIVTTIGSVLGAVIFDNGDIQAWEDTPKSIGACFCTVLVVLYCTLFTGADYIIKLKKDVTTANLEIHRLRVYEKECINRGIATATIEYKNSYMVLQAEDGNEADK